MPMTLPDKREEETYVMRAALEWLNSCSGCEIAILNIGEALVPLLTQHLDLVQAPDLDGS